MTPTQHPQVPAQPRLADGDGVGELKHGDLRDARKVSKDAQPGDTGERLVVGSKLS